MNVGAATETDYGYYFQWGDIVDKSNADCSWESYKYRNGSSDTLTKYCTDSDYGTVDNKTTLEPEDDAARAHMGSDWRMPTIAEFGELLDNTTKEWIKVNGVNGYKFTSSNNGNSIFIPAAGFCFDGSVYDVGYEGNVWSSSLNDSSNVDACFLNFNSDYISNDGENARYYGRSVRGVRK